MRAIHYLHWRCSSIILLFKKKIAFHIKYVKIKLLWKHHRPLQTSVPLQLTPNYPEGSHSLQLARSPRNASEGSVIRFRTLNLQASARVPVDFAGHRRVFIRDLYASSIVTPCFSPLVSRRWRQRETQFPSSNRDGTSTTKSGFTRLCNGRETMRREHKWGIFQACFDARKPNFPTSRSSSLVFYLVILSDE